MPALCAQQSVRAVLGADVRSALDRLEIVDSALATLRRHEDRGVELGATRVRRRPAWTPPERRGPTRNGGSRAPSRSRTGDARLA